MDETQRYFYVYGGTSDLGKLNDMWAFSLKDYKVNSN